MEARKPVTSNNSNIVDTIPFFKDLVITLGFSAIGINLLMCIVYTVILMIGKKYLLQKWLVGINFIFLIVQFYFFFFL